MEILSKNVFIDKNDKIYINKTAYDHPENGLHTHEFLEIVYIACGTADHAINGKTYKAREGDVYMMDYADVHTFEHRSSDFCIITCAFLPDMLDDSLGESYDAQDLFKLMLFQPFFEEDENLRFGLNLLHHGKEFGIIFEEMDREFKNKETGYQAVLKGYLTVLLSKLFRNIINKEPGNEPTPQSSIIEKAISFLQENYSKPFSLAELAKVVLLSPSYFSTMFKSQTGVSITDFTQKIRVSQACHLLLTTRHSVDEIRTMVGYNDSKFFYQVFKRYTGLTPGAYKKKHMGGN